MTKPEKPDATAEQRDQERKRFAKYYARRKRDPKFLRRLKLRQRSYRTKWSGAKRERENKKNRLRKQVQTWHRVMVEARAKWQRAQRSLARAVGQ